MEVFVFDWWWTSHQSHAHKSLRIHRFCIVSWKDERQSNVVWEDRFTWFESSRECRALDRIDGDPMEFEWNMLPGFNTLPLCHKDQKLMSRLSITPEKFSVWIIFMVQRHLMGSEDNKKESETYAQLVSLYAKKFGATQWSFFGPGQWLILRLGSEKKWNSVCANSPQGEWDKIAELDVKFGVRYTIALPLRRLKLFSHNCFCESAQFLRDSRRNVWRIWILSPKNGKICFQTIVPRSCQVWSGQPYFWMMILPLKNFYCKDAENELISYHNKTDWANFVLKQVFWLQLSRTVFHDERHWIDLAESLTQMDFIIIWRKEMIFCASGGVSLVQDRLQDDARWSFVKIENWRRGRIWGTGMCRFSFWKRWGNRVHWKPRKEVRDRTRAQIASVEKDESWTTVGKDEHWNEWNIFERSRRVPRWRKHKASITIGVRLQ